MTQLGGLSVISTDAEQLVLGISIKVPTSRQPGDACWEPASVSIDGGICCCCAADSGSSI